MHSNILIFYICSLIIPPFLQRRMQNVPEYNIKKLKWVLTIPTMSFLFLISGETNVIIIKYQQDICLVHVPGKIVQTITLTHKTTFLSVLIYHRAMKREAKFIGFEKLTIHFHYESSKYSSRCKIVNLLWPWISTKITTGPYFLPEPGTLGRWLLNHKTDGSTGLMWFSCSK